MTGRQLYTQFVSFGDLDATEAQTVGWIDMCQREVSMEIPVVYAKTVSPVIDGTKLTSTVGITKLISATDNLGNEYPLDQITVDEKELTFHQAADSLIVVYSGLSETYTSLTDELTIHPAFHSHIIYFLISMYYDMDGEGDSEESSMAERFHQRWMYYKGVAIASIQGSDYETSANTPISTADVLPITRRSRRVDSYYE